MGELGILTPRYGEEEMVAIFSNLEMYYTKQDSCQVDVLRGR